MLNALKGMKENKAPGSDGLPAEFYLTFWEEIKSILIKSFQHSFNSGKLPISHRKSIISLMFKKGERCELKNYRPLSLSNID